MTGAAPSLKHLAKTAFWSAVPLLVRKRAAIGISRSRLISNDQRLRLSMLAVGDLALRDNRAFHKFLWSNHLAYAVYYAAEERFRQPVEASRLAMFGDMCRYVDAAQVDSVLDVGCSVGSNLRHLEQIAFTSATRLRGIDIDVAAVDSGNRVLRAQGSRIRLDVADLEGMDDALGDETYDIVMCAGVLLYLDEQRATRAVAAMLGRARMLCAFASLAHPDTDNAELGHSVMRGWDSSHIHNVDAMVAAANGEIVGRRWEPGTIDGRQTIYFVFARPNS